MAITASEASARLEALIDHVNEDGTHIEIVSQHGNAVLMSRAEFDALEETAHLLRSRANARRLLEALEEAAGRAQGEGQRPSSSGRGERRAEVDQPAAGVGDS